MNHRSDPAVREFVAALEHLTGPDRGSVIWLYGRLLEVRLDQGQHVRIHAADDLPDGSASIALLRRDERSYGISAGAGQQVWVNGHPIADAVLRHGDTIEFGEAGPISRYRLLSGHPPFWRTLDDMVGDCFAYLRASRKPVGRRVTWAVTDLGRRLAWETTVVFRVGVLIALVALSVLLYDQSRRSAELEATLDAERIRLEGIAASLAKAREEALRPSDLTALGREFEERLMSSTERLRALEDATGATSRIIAQSIGAVALLQGAYGLRHAETGRMLRHVLTDEGIPIQTPLGQPLLSLEGTGPVAEVQFTGTGFLVRDGKLLVTNRHVAVPWLGKTDTKRLVAAGMEPVMVRFVAFVPGREAPIDISLRHVSETDDLAVLAMAAVPEELSGLPLAEGLPEAGSEVVVMGYPTGLRSLLAQSGPAFIKELEAAKDLDFWSVARRLSKAGMIVPLASRGIVGKVADQAVVYDAETTHGGSGGPVLDREGRVIAINTAILPEFGGSNLGLPVSRLKAMLDALESD